MITYAEMKSLKGMSVSSEDREKLTRRLLEKGLDDLRAADVLSYLGVLHNSFNLRNPAPANFLRETAKSYFLETEKKIYSKITCGDVRLTEKRLDRKKDCKQIHRAIYDGSIPESLSFKLLLRYYPTTKNHLSVNEFSDIFNRDIYIQPGVIVPDSQELNGFGYGYSILSNTCQNYKDLLVYLSLLRSSPKNDEDRHQIAHLLIDSFYYQDIGLVKDTNEVWYLALR